MTAPADEGSEMRWRRKDPKARLAAMVVRNENGCWMWNGATKPPGGYGSLIVGSRRDGTRKSMRAHRYSYMVHKGPIPDGLWVLHKCDTPACINPEHLFLGTRQDNTDDREAKGRNRPPTKLSTEQVAYIREMKGSKSSKDLAAELGVTFWHVKDIWRGLYRNPPPPQSGESP